MIDWPENILPLPKRDLSFQTDPRLLVQQMETGLRQRQRFSQTPESVSLVWEMTHVQWEYFKTFVRVNLFHGSASFNITLPTVNSLEERLQAKIKGGVFQEVHLTGGVDVSAELEIIKTPVLTEDVFYLISISSGILQGRETYDDEFIAMENRLFNFTNSIPS
jgi:hypothetical protein